MDKGRGCDNPRSRAYLFAAGEADGLAQQGVAQRALEVLRHLVHVATTTHACMRAWCVVCEGKERKREEVWRRRGESGVRGMRV